jgi:hypothetical protein
LSIQFPLRFESAKVCYPTVFKNILAEIFFPLSPVWLEFKVVARLPPRILDTFSYTFSPFYHTFLPSTGDNLYASRPVQQLNRSTFPVLPDELVEAAQFQKRACLSESSVFSHFSFQGFLVLVQAKQANKVEK